MTLLQVIFGISIAAVFLAFFILNITARNTSRGACESCSSPCISGKIGMIAVGVIFVGLCIACISGILLIIYPGG